MTYCPDALKLLNKKIVCGKDCPIYKKCPRLILEDAKLKIDEIGRKLYKL